MNENDWRPNPYTLRDRESIGFIVLEQIRVLRENEEARQLVSKCYEGMLVDSLPGGDRGTMALVDIGELDWLTGLALGVIDADKIKSLNMAKYRKGSNYTAKSLRCCIASSRNKAA